MTKLMRRLLFFVTCVTCVIEASSSSQICDSADEESWTQECTASSRSLLQKAQKIKLGVPQHAVPEPSNAQDSSYLQVEFAADANKTEQKARWYLYPATDGVCFNDVLFLWAWVIGLSLLGLLGIKAHQWYSANTSSGDYSAAETLLENTATPKATKLPSEAECIGRLAPNTRSSLCLPELFFHNTVQYEKKTALVAWVHGLRVEVSYGKFGELTRKVAKQLLTLGIKRGDRVLLMVHRGVHQLVSIYACMAVGAVWVPVDPDVPDSWLEYVQEDSEAALIIEEEKASNSSRAKIPVVKAPVDGSQLVTDKGEVVKASDGGLPSHQRTDPVVVFYTSGSTGKPKGVLHSFEQLEGAAYGIAEDSNVSKDSIALLRSPAVWSTFEWEAFPAIMVGATLIVAEPQGHKDPMYLARTLDEESVNMIAITPKSLDLVLDAVENQGYRLTNLSDVASTGEQLPVALANRFVNMLPHVKLHNGYNPTESAACTWYVVPQGGLDSKKYPTNAPAGIPQPGVAVYIMDPDDKAAFKQLPEGEDGEILLGGLLSEGYWRRPELTKEKFVTHPKFGRLYHTGDKGRWEDGQLLTMGRIDRQVKVRGIRVEPEEVEAIMSGVWSNLRDKDAAGGGAGVACVATLGASPELVAFVAPMASTEELAALEKAVRANLPAYYCPSRFETLSKLPALPNGKVDLKSLQATATQMSEDQSVMAKDSLGIAKAMMKSAVIEQDAIFHFYVQACIGTIVSHVYSCGMTSQGCQPLAAIGAVPSWVSLITRAYSDEWTLGGFMLLFAYQDGKRLNGDSHPQIRWGQKDAIFLWLYFAIGWLSILVPNLFYREQFHAMIPGYSTNPNDFVPFGGFPAMIRWFLGCILLFRAFIYIWQKIAERTKGAFRVPGWVQLLLWCAICWNLTPAGFVDVCADPKAPMWLKIFFGNIGMEMSYPNHCPLLLGFHGWFGFYYVISFHYSEDVVKKAKVVIRKYCDGPEWGLAALAAFLCITFWFSWFRFADIQDMTNFTDAHADRGPHWLPFDFSVCIIQVCLFVFAASWFPFHVRYLGKGLLGSYLTHAQLMLCFVAMSMPKDASPSATTTTPSPAAGFIHSYSHGLGLLILAVAGPLLYMATLGPLMQYLLMWPAMKVIEKLNAQKASDAQTNP
eukprot:TRINITY_DN3792_c2_g1_i1.p1 TRINITY_DN3792_c2_g1~~TRINITY_DN3792_c2_g1_i1.p1  ORF type:complete len:1147 (-),score=212.67 TRINITY_DN3792_c2_g1_i1:342-3782(-)